MSKVFTFFCFVVFLLCSSRARSQSCSPAPTCPGIREDFNGADGGFASSNGYVYNNSTGDFRVLVTSPQTTYTISSNLHQFLIGSNTTTATIGFNIGGTAQLSQYSITIKDVNSLTQTVCNTSGVNAATATVCAQLTIPAELRGKNVIVIVSVATRNEQQGGSGGVTTFDNFRTDLPEPTVTPVSFTSFDAKKLAAGTQLTWKVGVEENVSHYEIERSNGASYESVGSVPASGQSSYSFTDPQGHNGTVLYRIRSVDKDGQYKYSTIISLKNGVASVLFKAFPIPAGNTLTVQHPAVIENGKIIIASSDGRTVKSVLPAKGSMQTDIKLDGLNSGIYLLRFNRGNGELQTMKIIKQ